MVSGVTDCSLSMCIDCTFSGFQRSNRACPDTFGWPRIFELVLAIAAILKADAGAEFTMRYWGIGCRESQD